MAIKREYHLKVRQGDHGQMTVTLKAKSTGLPRNLTGHAFTAQVRSGWDADSTLLLALTCALDADPTTGRVVVSYTAAATAPLAPAGTAAASKAEAPLGVWDLQSVDGSGKVRTWLRGPASLIREATR